MKLAILLAAAAIQKTAARVSRSGDRTAEIWCSALLADPTPEQPCWDAHQLKRRHQGYFKYKEPLGECLKSSSTTAKGEPCFPSEGGQDRWLWLHHFRHLERPIVYADLGSNDALYDSNSFFFDECTNATGLCVDASASLGPRYDAWRACKFVPTCLSDKEREVVFAVGGTNADQASTRSGVLENNKSYRDDLNTKNLPHTDVKMNCTTAGRLFAEHGLTHIDLLDLDAEGHETAILKGIDWDAVTIDIVMVEANDREVHQLLARLGYTLHKTLHRSDGVFLRRGFSLLDPDTSSAECVQW